MRCGALMRHQHRRRQMFGCYSLLALVLGAIKSILFIALDQRPLPCGLQHCGVSQNTKACQMGIKRLGERRVE